MKRIKMFFIALFNIIFTQSLLAQNNSADFMTSIGKIYVVVGVLAVIFIGIVLYLIRLDLKLSKLENQINKDGK